MDTEVNTASRMYALRELERLLDETIERATRLIASEGSLDAFFMAITSMGKRVDVPSGAADSPPEGSTLETLRAYVGERLAKREYRALALAQDVNYRPDGADSSTTAIQVTLDHRDIEPVTCYLPYQRVDGQIKQGELAVIGPLERFFGERRATAPKATPDETPTPEETPTPDETPT